MSGSYFCACVTRKFSRKLLPLPVAPSTSVCPTSCDVQVEGVRRVVRRLEDRERLPAQMRADRLARVEREQEAQVGDVRLEQREPAQVVRAVAGHDARARRSAGCRSPRRALPSCAARPSSPRRPGAAGPARPAPCSTSVSEQLPKKWPLTSSSVSASPSWRTVALAESSTSISSGRVSGDT